MFTLFVCKGRHNREKVCQINGIFFADKNYFFTFVRMYSAKQRNSELKLYNVTSDE